MKTRLKMKSKTRQAGKNIKAPYIPKNIDISFLPVYPMEDSKVTLNELVKSADILGLELHIIITEKKK